MKLTPEQSKARRDKHAADVACANQQNTVDTLYKKQVDIHRLIVRCQQVGEQPSDTVLRALKQLEASQDSWRRRATKW